MSLVAKTFRVFVSSTFDDFVDERNVLQDEVFPELRRRCEERGFRFQPIDLRWGVPLEAASDQRVMEICLSEIDHCREISPRPNFLVLLGDRYGWRPLPPTLSEAEFATIAGRIADEADARYFASWYPLDANAVPSEDDPDEHEHYLAPVDGSPEREPWDEGRLRRVVDQAVVGTELERVTRIVGSATEQEIEKGALSVPDAPEHVFWFVRSIERSSDDEPVLRAARFLDEAPGDLAPDEAERHLDDVRSRLDRLDERLVEALGAEHRFGYSRPWAGGALGGEEALARFGDEVRERLWRVIEAEIEGREVDPIAVEAKAHELFAEDRASHFQGRVGVLGRIAAYCADPDGRPLALWGEPGSGKSSVVAKASRDALEVHGDRAVLIERFVGATAASSDGASLLRDLCREISREYGDATEPPSAYRDLVEAFPERMALATAERPLLLFVDAVNQLSDADRARSLAWLPTTLPEHVALVVSAATEPPESTRALEAKLPEDHLLELEPMPVEEAELVLDLWLRDAHRTLQPAQREEVLSKFREEGEEGLPLYLKLAFEEARLWRSGEAHELHPGIQGLIQEDLFRRLEAPAAHGPMLVDRALGYLGAGKNGLTEDELLDVLAADEGFWSDFVARSQQQHELPARQVPVSVWSRLFFDLRPYLVERAADGTALLGFYHLQLAEAVAARYLDGGDGVARYAALASYFAARRDRQGLEGNLRVLSELPYQQTRGRLWDPLFETLTDFTFLERKATDVGVVVSTDVEGNETRTYTGVYALEEDFALALREMPGGDGQDADDRRRVILTATDLGDGLQIRCPHCNRYSNAREEWLGRDIACPHEDCAGPLRVNPFTVPSDARFAEPEPPADLVAEPVPLPPAAPVPDAVPQRPAVPLPEPVPETPAAPAPEAPQAEMTPGASKVVEAALALAASHPCLGMGANHWLAAALERYGPMAEGIAPGLDAADGARAARAALEAGDAGPPMPTTDVIAWATGRARSRGKATVAERDLLSAILGDPSPPSTPAQLLDEARPADDHADTALGEGGATPLLGDVLARIAAAPSAVPAPATPARTTETALDAARALFRERRYAEAGAVLADVADGPSPLLGPFVGYLEAIASAMPGGAELADPPGTPVEVDRLYGFLVGDEVAEGKRRIDAGEFGPAIPALLGALEMCPRYPYANYLLAVAATQWLRERFEAGDPPAVEEAIEVLEIARVCANLGTVDPDVAASASQLVAAIEQNLRTLSRLPGSAEVAAMEELQRGYASLMEQAGAGVGSEEQLRRVRDTFEGLKAKADAATSTVTSVEGKEALVQLTAALVARGHELDSVTESMRASAVTERAAKGYMQELEAIVRRLGQHPVGSPAFGEALVDLLGFRQRIHDERQRPAADVGTLDQVLSVCDDVIAQISAAMGTEDEGTQAKSGKKGRWWRRG